jgi:Xaa-Pro aminopeptidase
MLLEKRLDDLTKLIQEKDMDGLVIGASGDLAYLTGLSPLSDAIYTTSNIRARP